MTLYTRQLAHGTDATCESCLMCQTRMQSHTHTNDTCLKKAKDITVWVWP